MLEAEKDSPLRMAASVVSGESFGAKCIPADGKTNPYAVRRRKKLGDWERKDRKERVCVRKQWKQ